VSFSLNEVEALAKKAARGAGYPWGLAEEAARATRWLCARDVDGCTELADLLDVVDGTDLRARAPQTGNGSWTGQDPLCPIVAGAALSDRAEALRTAPLRFDATLRPMLLVAFAAQSARQLDTTLILTWPGTVAVTDGAQLRLTGPPCALADRVAIAIGGDVADASPRTTRADPPPDIWNRLNRFAHRTYAPATAASRLKGAGAGLSDTD
jgi:hypothetical protein